MNERVSPPAAPHKAASARELAARAVHRVRSEQAFASEALDDELARSQLPERDRALATELCHGTLRFERALERELTALAPRGLVKGDELGRAHLLVAAYQILLLDRVPAFAAINEAVATLTRLRGPRVAGFANAILRRLAASGRQLSRGEALRAALEPWLLDELTRSIGADALPALIGADAAARPRGLCIRLTARCPADPEWAAGAEHGLLAPRARWVGARGDLRARPGYAEGHFAVQEEGAQWAALALGARPGERVLDACAGHGTKSALLAERLAPESTLWVNDIAAAKLARLRREFERLGLQTPHCHKVDLAVGTGDLPAGFDRILVDAPCTGTGTLRSRPEILRRLRPDDPRRLAEQSVRLLEQTAQLLKPGGRLVFVVCSVLHEECEALVERASTLLEPAPFDAPEALAVTGPGASSYRLLPSLHGTDGYFVASFVRRG